jgi:K+-sensing histidine kinase KdpD
MAHELRNHLWTATLSVAALEQGSLPISGATGAVLKRSLASLKTLIDRSLEDVSKQHQGAALEAFSLASFIADVQSASALEARAKACPFLVSAVDPLLTIRANRGLILAAVSNLLQNAFKFTLAHTQVTLRAHASGNRVLIDVEDCCGGLDPETVDDLFKPFVQVGQDRTGLGLGLSIARQNIEADGGTLSVRKPAWKGLHLLDQPAAARAVLGPTNRRVTSWNIATSIKATSSTRGRAKNGRAASSGRSRSTTTRSSTTKVNPQLFEQHMLDEAIARARAKIDAYPK